jgi:2-polyprenyl-6-methoxyphenol hydroxylase-like FAD-dependent oxidoreductase
VSGSVLVGADGIQSVVRAQLHGVQAPRFTGIVIWRAVTEFDDDALPSGALVSLWGRGTRFVAFRVAEGMMSWEATHAAAADGVDPPEGPKAELLELFAEYRDPVRPLIEATDGRAIVRDDVCDRPPLESWGMGRVTLLGDAAHPMTFAVGQGAAQALEDAVALSGAVAGGGACEVALRAYERKRIKRTAHFQSLAWRLARMGLAERRPSIAMRNAFLQGTSAVGKRLQIKDLRVPD